MVVLLRSRRPVILHIRLVQQPSLTLLEHVAGSDSTSNVHSSKAACSPSGARMAAASLLPGRGRDCIRRLWSLIHSPGATQTLSLILVHYSEPSKALYSRSQFSGGFASIALYASA